MVGFSLDLCFARYERKVKNEKRIEKRTPKRNGNFLLEIAVSFWCR
jgi:hypothetical protein